MTEERSEQHEESYDSLEGAGMPRFTEDTANGVNVNQMPTHNDAFYMQRMIEMLVADGRRRDEMFERVLSGLTPQTTSTNSQATEQPAQTFHVMPDMSKVIGFFDGDKDICKAEDWVKSIETSATLNRWPENYQLETARAHLKGPAIFWYKSKQDTINTWDDFKREFYSSYKLSMKLPQKWDKMRARRQQKNESVTSYFYEKLSLCQTLDLEIGDSIQEILTGLYSREVAATLVAKNYSDFDTLLHDIITTEKIRYPEWRQPKPNVQGYSKQRPSAEVANSSTVTKENTSSSEHRNVEQKQHRLPARNSEGKPLCFVCKTYGHVSKYCKLKQPEAPKETLTTSTSRGTSYAGKPNDDNLKYFKDAKIAGRSIHSYVDQGSKCVLLRRSDAESLGLKFQPVDAEIVIKGYGAGEVKPCGRIYTEIEVDEAKAQTEILIVPDDAQSIPLLIGQPFTEQKHVTIIRRRDTLRLFNEPIDTEDQNDNDILKLKIPDLPHSKVNLWAKDKVVIPPNYVGFVTMITEPPTLDDLYIEAHLSNEKVIPRCIARPDDEYKVTLPISNLTEQDIIIAQGEKVVRADNCEEIRDDDIQKFVTEVCKIEVNKSTRVKQILDQCEIGDDVTENQKKKLEEILTEFSHTFALHVSEIGCYKDMTMKIALTSDDKITYRPYRLGYAERLRVKEQIEELKQAGIVEDSNSEYGSPILIVRKKNGEERICIDYRGLNAITKKEKYPLPLIDDQLDRLEGKKYFTSLDMKSGYYQVPLDDESKPLTAFVTPDGHYQFNRMPFGLVCGPSVFQKMINRVLGPLRYTIVMAYMDDLLLPSTTIDEGLDILKEVLNVLREANLTLNPKKCSFFCNKVDYLGFEVSMGSIRPGERKVSAIRNFPRPESVHQVRQFLGLTSYFRRFIKGYGIVAKPLTSLLKQDIPWSWTDAQERAYETLKEQLCQHPVLQIYSPVSPTEVHTDASQKGISGVLLQKNSDGELHPIMYASRQTTKEEAKYHSTEVETLAVIWSCEKFKPYLKNQQFKLVTDCNAVRSVFAKKDLIPRIGRWWLRMQEFDFVVEHRPGISMKHVDALSRNPFDDPEEVEIVEGLDVMTISLDHTDWLILAQRKDKKIQNIVDTLTKRACKLTKEEKQIRETYVLEEGRVYRKLGDKKLWVVPKEIRWRILKLCHDDVGHPAVDKTTHKVLEGYWFPRLKRYVKGYIGSCLECLYHKCPGGKKPGELRSIDKIGTPYHTIHLDHLGPFIKSNRGNSYIIVSIDGFTKHVMLKAVKDTSSDKATKFLNEIVDIFGPPTRVITDQGTSYTSNVFKRYCQSKNIQHIQNATSTPRANGQVERVNRVITPALASLSKDPEGKDWDKHIGRLQYGLNNTVHQAIKTTPFNLLFNYRPRDYDGNPIVDEKNRWQGEDRSAIDIKRQKALEQIKEDQYKQRERYNKKRGKSPRYLEGDLVLIRRDPPSTGQSRKLAEKYAGPYIVTQKFPNDRYRVSDLPETQRSQRFYDGTVAVDAMKNYNPIMENSTDDSSSESERELKSIEDNGNELNEKQKEHPEDKEKERPHRNRKLPQKFKEYELAN